MAYKRILEYQAGLNTDQHRGRIILKLEGETGMPEMGVFDPPEFHAIIDILRNEKPLYYDRDLKQLWTLHEPTGEGEN
ncbi:MAG: hypothetical protein QNJ46_28525 [Leptolyngbyaceae cyanobacterium MO_188.B28]|nr:hypothetical protein [Leptolyngbyaceae cyanobacterium MO_188.B28]